MKKLLYIFMILTAMLMLCSCNDDDIPDIPEVGQFTTGSYDTLSPNEQEGAIPVRDAIYEEEQYYAQQEIDMYSMEDELLNGFKYTGYTAYQRVVDLMLREKLNLELLERTGYVFDDKVKGAIAEYKERLNEYLKDKTMTYYHPAEVPYIVTGTFDSGWRREVLKSLEKNSSFLKNDPKLKDIFMYSHMEINHSSTDGMFTSMKNQSVYYLALSRGLSLTGEPLSYTQRYDSEKGRTVIELSRKADVIVSYEGSALYKLNYIYEDTDKLYLPASYNGSVSIAEIAEYGFVHNFKILEVNSETDPKAPIEFQNSKLEKAVREHLKKGEDEAIYQKDLTSITTIVFYGDNVFVNKGSTALPKEVLSDKTVVSGSEIPLDDLKYFQHLMQIDIVNMEFDEFDMYCLNMQAWVIIKNCNLKAIKGCEGVLLRKLELFDSQVSDLTAFSDLVALEILELCRSEINQIKLPDTVTDLTLNNMDVSDISFVNDSTELNAISIINCEDLDLSQINSSVWESVITVRLPAGIDHEFLLEYDNIKRLYVGDEKIK